VIPFLRPALPPLEDYAARLRSVWETGVLSGFGREAEGLERLGRELLGADHVLCAASADLGLTLAVAAIGVPPGGVALVSSFTFPSTVNALVWNGLRPRFVDVSPATFAANAEAVESALDDEVGLVMVTHPFGVPGEVGRLDALAAAAGVPIVYDAAHAAGTYIGDRHVGRFGTVSVLSLSPAKLTTAAEGALVHFADEAVAERFRHLRNYGFLDDEDVLYHGLNGRMSELHATLGSMTLPRIEEFVAARDERIARYREVLDEVAGVRPQGAPPGTRPGRTAFAVTVAGGRDALADHLGRRGIEVRTYFRPLHRMARFAGFAPAPLPETDRLGDEVLCLPLYPALPLDAVDRIAAEIRSFLGA
jgi:dTDP-4-amino-4,6-dideoxygalactose transaminase